MRNLIFGFGIVAAMYVFTAQGALACAFNCSNSPELRASGFVSKNDQTFPYANEYRNETPLPTIDNAENKKLVIWLHGQDNPRQKESCSAQYNLPPKTILALDERADTHVYYHCTSVIDPKMDGDNVPDDGVHYIHGRAYGYYTLGRRDELETLLDRFLDIGVLPANIVLAGHSAGAWTALLAAASYPEKFNGLIAFAPSFAGKRREEKRYPWWRKIIRPEQVEMIIRPNTVRKLVFAYEDDLFNRPAELAFIEQAFPETATVISQDCGKGHDTHKSDCASDQTLELMTQIIFE